MTTTMTMMRAAGDAMAMTRRRASSSSSSFPTTTNATTAVTTRETTRRALVKWTSGRRRRSSILSTRATPRRRSDDHKGEEEDYNYARKNNNDLGDSARSDVDRSHAYEAFDDVKSRLYGDGSMVSFVDAIRDPALRRRAMGLEERLRDCVTTENFLGAARARDELIAVRRRDPRARCEDDLREALMCEDYRRAATMRAALEEMDRDDAVEAATPCESERTTRGVRVRVRSRFVADRSAPEEERWFFQYVVTITNVSAEGTVKLLSRSWLIVDDEGRAEAVRGAGVVGKQPSIRRGETFEYASSTPLKTCRGTMEGFYRFVALEPREEARERAEGGRVDLSREDDVDAFNVEIGIFGLSKNAVF